MPSIFILSAYPEIHGNQVAKVLRESGKSCIDTEYRLSESPESADTILFAEAHPVDDPLFFQVATHPLRRRHPEKCFLYSDTDYAFPLMRGLYPSLCSNDSDSMSFRGAAYYGQVDQNRHIRPLENCNESLLGVFSGAMTHPVRPRLMKALSGDRRFRLRDTSGKQGWMMDGQEKDNYQESYARELHDAHFILCPRGIGPSSYRLFEAMKAGKCPVIISDDWTAPVGPDWAACSIRVRESELERIPSILENERLRSRMLGRAARAAWEQFFSPENAFRTLASQCVELSRHPVDSRYQAGLLLSQRCRGHLLRALRFQGLGLAPRLVRHFLRR